MLTKAIFGRLWRRYTGRHMLAAVYRCAAAVAFQRVAKTPERAGEHYELGGMVDGAARCIRHMINDKRESAKVESLMETAKALEDFRLASQPFDDWLTGRNVVAEVVHWWRGR
jgi:hypothetical protein